MTEPAGTEVPFYFMQHARFVDQLSLVATDSAVSVARNFAKLTLFKWRARTIAADAALIVSELVTNGVKATGALEQSPPWSELSALDLVFVRIVGLDASIVVEVWDTSADEPVLQNPDDEAEGGRGLLLVNEAASRWGWCRTPRGKFVWAEIAVPEAIPSSLPRRRTSERVGRPLVRADPWLLQRLLIGLRHI